MAKQTEHEFWVTNVSQNKDVSLADLRLTIRSGESRNLLDPKHYSYTLEELQKSASSGSIKAKSNVIKVRDVRPHVVVEPGIYISQSGRLVAPLRNKIETKPPSYEELDVVVEKEVQESFAAEEADIVEEDARPALAVDAKYRKSISDE